MGGSCFDPAVVPALEFIGDAFPFVHSGFPPVDTTSRPSDMFYHTELDTPDRMCIDVVKTVADSVASLIVWLASHRELTPGSRP